jgi:serine/threonine-protein kinase
LEASVTDHRPAGSGLAPVAGYRIEAMIGRGGMATVFRAHDEQLGRTVALKVLAPALAADREFRSRFIRESRAAAAVDHAHIIPVFQAGEANGVLFIAMRLVRGGDLREQLSQVGRLPPAAVANIVSQIASALDAAHRHGLVHRDVKPGNILLDVADDALQPDQVYLSDFGLSKNSIAPSTLTALTAVGQVLGTLDYVAPEQIDGKAVDGRADQYSLACTAYEMLCGTPPFGEHPSTKLMRAHRSDLPPPISSRRPDLPRGTDAVFARALAKAPQDRYGNCAEFAIALRAVLSLETQQAHAWAAPVQEPPARPRPRSSAAAPSPQPPLTPDRKPAYPAGAPTIRRDKAQASANRVYAERTEIDQSERIRRQPSASQVPMPKQSRRWWPPWRRHRLAASL